MSVVSCPHCGSALELRVITAAEPPCVTCHRPISEHFEKYGHASWCAFPSERATPARNVPRADEATPS